MVDLTIMAIPQKGDSYILGENEDGEKLPFGFQDYMAMKYFGTPVIFIDKAYRKGSESEATKLCIAYWDLFKDKKIPLQERFLFVAFFYKMIIKREELPRVIDAMREYYKIRDDEIYPWAISILEKIINDPNVFGIYFYESVCGDPHAKDVYNKETLDRMIKDYQSDGDIEYFVDNASDVIECRGFNIEKDWAERDFNLMEDYKEWLQ